MWESVINEVDIDGNGEIDFEEFCIMMEKMIICCGHSQSSEDSHDGHDHDHSHGHRHSYPEAKISHIHDIYEPEQHKSPT